MLEISMQNSSSETVEKAFEQCLEKKDMVRFVVMEGL